MKVSYNQIILNIDSMLEETSEKNLKSFKKKLVKLFDNEKYIELDLLLLKLSMNEKKMLYEII